MARKNSNLISSRSVINASEQTPAVTQGQTVFANLNTIDTDRVDVFKNGIKLVKTEDYSIDSATSITLTNGLDDSDHLSIMSIGNLSYASIPEYQSEEYPTVTNGSPTVAMSKAHALSEIEVYLNGIKLRGGNTLGGVVEFTVSGTTLTFDQNLSTGDEVVVVTRVKLATVDLVDLGDTNMTGISNGELIKYDSDTAKYIPSTLNEDASGNIIATGTIQDAQGNVRALEVTTDATSSVTIASGSSGKYFRLTGTTVTININAGNFAAGDIITLHNATSSDMTIDFDANFTDTVYIAGDGTDKNNSTITLAAYGLATCIAFTSAGMIINGNVS